MQPHLRGAHGPLADLLAEGAASDATAALEEEVRTLRGRLAASEDLLRLRRRAGHFDARTEALIADIARASTPGPVDMIHDRASTSRADEGPMGQDSRAVTQSREVSRADPEPREEPEEPKMLKKGLQKPILWMNFLRWNPCQRQRPVRALG